MGAESWACPCGVHATPSSTCELCVLTCHKVLNKYKQKTDTSTRRWVQKEQVSSAKLKRDRYVLYISACSRSVVRG